MVIIKDKFFFFKYIKVHVVTSHLNRLIEAVQMKSHNMLF